MIYTSTDVDSSLGSTSVLGTDAHARHGYFPFCGIRPDNVAVISGKSQLQTTVALSTCESELTAASAAGRALVGLRNLIHDLFLDKCATATPILYGDNQAANKLASGEASLRHLRHLQLPAVWIRELTANNELVVRYKNTRCNTADMLTKILPEETVTTLRSFLGLKNTSAP